MFKRILPVAICFLLMSACDGGDGPVGGGGGASGNVGIPPGNSGDVVTSLNENPLSTVCQTQGGTLFFGSLNGKILVSNDNGNTITVLDSTLFEIFASICDAFSPYSERLVCRSRWFGIAVGRYEPEYFRCRSYR